MLTKPDTVGRWLDTIPLGGSVSFWTIQGTWLVRSRQRGAGWERPNYAVEWRANDGDGRMKSLMGGPRVVEGWTRFVMDNGHWVELSLDAQAQTITFAVGGVHAETFPLAAPQASGT
jgi:hypothetical protein